MVNSPRLRGMKKAWPWDVDFWSSSAPFLKSFTAVGAVTTSPERSRTVTVSSARLPRLLVSCSALSWPAAEMGHIHRAVRRGRAPCKTKCQRRFFIVDHIARLQAVGTVISDAVAVKRNIVTLGHGETAKLGWEWTTL